MKGLPHSRWQTIRLLLAALVLVLFALAFSGFGGLIAPLAHLQFAPALAGCFAAFTAGALITVLGIALFTFLFGRIYCSVLCPFGILQDLIAFPLRKRKIKVPNLPLLRYAIAGVVFGALAAGWAAGLLLLDPYSNFGRILGAFLSGGFVPLLVIAALALWKRRIFCTALCPVGTLLGLIAKFSLFRLHFTEQCVKCGRCATACPTGCIDPRSGTLDNERCVRCMSCVAACNFHGLAFSRPKAAEIPVDPSRRAFLLRGGVLVAGLAAGAVLVRTGLSRLAELPRRFGILPPGAQDAERFAAKCTSCQLCTANCPKKIIVPAPGGTGPVSLDLNRGVCRYNCNLCSQLCPTGAIRPLTLKEKQLTKIAEAKFNPRNCIVFQEEEECGRCASACPAHAITLRDNGTPRPVNTALCIGCGACQMVCPAPEKAMTVHEIEKQVTLPEPVWQ